MYHHLRGKVMELTPTSLVLEVGGVGYDLRIPLSTFDVLKGAKEAKEASVFTHLQVREDDLRLFGFATVAERELFRFLVSVSGVGPATAIAALCSLTPKEIAQAIGSGDLKTLQKIKGVGKKLAERMNLELRDRVGSLMVLLGVDEALAAAARAASGAPAGPQRVPEALDAIDALVAIGFDRKSAEERVDVVLRKVGPKGPRGRDVEWIIKECLRSS